MSETHEITNTSNVPQRGAVDTPPPAREPEYRTARPAGGAVKYIVVAALVLAVGAGGFAAGFGLGKGTGSTASAGGFGTNGSSRGFGERMNGGFGTVTAVSGSSITISETGPGGMGSGTGSTNSSTTSTTKTYAITSSTTVTNDGASANVSDIAVGDTVMIRTASSTSTDATSIRLNPTMGQPGAAADGSAGTTGTTSGSTT